MAAFKATITGTADATWQGMVASGGESFQFQSELQLLRWLMEQYPAPRPEVGQERCEDAAK